MKKEQSVMAVIFYMLINDDEISEHEFYSYDGVITDDDEYKGNNTSILFCGSWFDLTIEQQRKAFFKAVKKGIFCKQAKKTVKTVKNLAELYFSKQVKKNN
jgi:hypothetical protein